MDKKSVRAVKKFLDRVGENYDINRAILFGSRARDDYMKNSDVDILLVSDDFKGSRFPSRSAEMLKYWNFEHGDPEFLCYTQKEFKEMKNKLTIVREAANEGTAVKA